MMFSYQLYRIGIAALGFGRVNGKIVILYNHNIGEPVSICIYDLLVGTLEINYRIGLKIFKRFPGAIRFTLIEARPLWVLHNQVEFAIASQVH